MKNSPFTNIEFLIDIVGPISLLPEHWYVLSHFFQVLDNIETRENIEQSKRDGKIKKVSEDEYFWIENMNRFLGNQYSESDLKEIVNNKIINNDSQKYQEMINIVKNSFPINFIDGRYPLLCEYCGNDQEVGVVHYSYIKEKYDKNLNSKEIESVYMKYRGHEQYYYEMPESKDSMREMYIKILEYVKNFLIIHKFIIIELDIYNILYPIIKIFIKI